MTHRKIQITHAFGLRACASCGQLADESQIAYYLEAGGERCEFCFPCIEKALTTGELNFQLPEGIDATEAIELKPIYDWQHYGHNF